MFGNSRPILSSALLTKLYFKYLISFIITHRCTKLCHNGINMIVICCHTKQKKHHYWKRRYLFFCALIVKPKGHTIKTNVSDCSKCWRLSESDLYRTCCGYDCKGKTISTKLKHSETILVRNLHLQFYHVTLKI
jgi:hypothetical protein